MPDREEQPGLEPVFPDHCYEAAATQSDYYLPQSFYSSLPENVSQSTSRFEDSLPEAVKSDSSLEPVYPGYHPGAPFRQPDHSGPQYLCTSSSEKPEAFTTRPDEVTPYALPRHRQSRCRIWECRRNQVKPSPQEEVHTGRSRSRALHSPCGCTGRSFWGTSDSKTVPK